MTKNYADKSFPVNQIISTTIYYYKLLWDWIICSRSRDVRNNVITDKRCFGELSTDLRTGKQQIFSLLNVSLIETKQGPKIKAVCEI